MSCNTQCATATDYTKGWQFFGRDSESLSSHYFDVGSDPIIMVAEGLVPGQCIRFEQVFGCGSGDTFIPFVQDCCPLTICPPRNSATLTQSGRYRMVLIGTPTPEPEIITVYGRPQKVAPGYGGNEMSCCSCGPTPDWTVNTGGTLINGTLPNPSITGGAITGATLVNVQLGIDCNGNPVMSGSALARCSDIPTIPPAQVIPTTLPPSGPAGGDLTGTYPNPSFRPGAPVLKSCGNLTIGVGDTVVTCADLTASITDVQNDLTAYVDAQNAAQDAIIAAKQGQLLDCTGAALPANTQVARCSDIPVIPAAVVVSTTDPYLTVSPTAGGYDIAFNEALLAATHPLASFTVTTPASLAMALSAGGNGQQFDIGLNLATVPDVTTFGATTGLVVTDQVLRDILGSGQDRYINTSRSGSAMEIHSQGAGATAYFFKDATGNTDEVAAYAAANNTNGTAFQGETNGGGAVLRGTTNGAVNDGSALYIINAAAAGAGHGAVVRITGGVIGNVISANHEGAGGGSGVFSELLSATNGHAIYGAVGNNAGGSGSTGSGRAGTFVNGPNGTRDAVFWAGNAAANTTWAGVFNGNLLVTGAVTTSDERLKSNIGEIDVEAAIKLYHGVRWVEFDKRNDTADFERMDAEKRAEAAEIIKAFDKSAKTKAKGAKVDEDAAKQASDARKLLASKVLDYKAMSSVYRQTGVIAQELQKLVKEIGAFGYLVQKRTPSDVDSILAVDYQSLDAILHVARRELERRLDERLTKAGF